MKHKIKVTVIDKKLYPELQKQYCMDPNSGACLCYNVGDENLSLSAREARMTFGMGALIH